MAAKGRKPQVKYFPSKGGYYTTYQGVRHTLARGPEDSPHGPTYQTAVKAYSALICRSEPEGKAAVLTMREAIEGWQKHIEKAGCKEGHTVACRYLSGGLDRWGDKLTTDLRLSDVERWLESEEGWGSTTRNIAFRRLRTALNWNVEQGNISTNPIGKAKLPVTARQKCRGADYVMSDELIALLIRAAGKMGGLQDYIHALAKTGARPGEIANAQDYHYQKAIGAIVYAPDPDRGYRHKNARHGKERVIYLPPEIVEMVERRIAKQGKGHIWRGTYGANYATKNSRNKFGELKKREEVAKYLAENDIDSKHVILYGLRHTVITKALLQGASIKLVADAMGTSVSVIEKNYAHAVAEKDAMRKFFLEYFNK